MYKISSESIGDVKKYVWHYRKDNKEYGPFTYEDIVEMVKRGEIGPEDYLLKFGNRKFFKASEVQGLFDDAVQTEVLQEEQAVVTMEQIAVSKEESREEAYKEFETRAAQAHANHKREPYGSKLIMAAAGLLGLCLAVWAIIKLF